MASQLTLPVTKNLYDGSPFRLRLPTPFHLARLMLKHGRGCLLFTLDLKRAFRQLLVDPFDWPLLGLTADTGFYWDLAIPFGVTHGSSCCNRVSQAVCYICKNELNTDSTSYIDDLAAVSPPDTFTANTQYIHMRLTLEELGLEANPDKCQPPTTRLTWIGVTFDSIQMRMWIHTSKIAELINLICKTLTTKFHTLNSLQKLTGKIFHCTKLSPPARRFLNNLLDSLRTASRSKTPVTLSALATADLHWLLHMLPLYNGIHLIQAAEPTVTLEIDACPSGLGGHLVGTAFYNFALPHFFTQFKLSIASIECFNMLVALRVWAHQLTDTCVLLHSDNIAAVNSANSGKATDPLIRSTLRELWLICALHRITLTIAHKPGALLIVPDLLSRAHLPDKQTQFAAFLQSTTDTHVALTDKHWLPPICI